MQSKRRTSHFAAATQIFSQRVSFLFLVDPTHGLLAQPIEFTIRQYCVAKDIYAQLRAAKYETGTCARTVAKAASATSRRRQKEKIRARGFDIEIKPIVRVEIDMQQGTSGYVMPDLNGICFLPSFADHGRYEHVEELTVRENCSSAPSERERSGEDLRRRGSGALAYRCIKEARSTARKLLFFFLAINK